MRISTEFQNRFKELLQDLNITNKTLAAEKIGITYVTFSKALNYGIVPKIAVLIKLADFFNVSIEYLLAMTDEEYFEKSANPKTFPERLNYLREKKGIPTIYVLADQIHIHRNIIGQWINKNYIPELDNLEIIADFFNVSLDYLLGRTDYEK